MSEKKKALRVLILAAGYGTRLYPITKDTPKPLLLVEDRPIIDHLLDKIASSGCIKEVFVVTNDKFYSNFCAWRDIAKEEFEKLSIKIINDGSTSVQDRLGAMGDISFVARENHLKDDILVVGGDNLFDQGLEEYIKFSLSDKHKATLGLFDIKNKRKASNFGVVRLDKDMKVISFEEKPKNPNSSLIAMCLYYFSSEIFSLIFRYLEETGKHDTTGDFINWLHNRVEVFGFTFKGRWDDIGHIDSLCSWEDEYCKFKERSVKQ